MAAVGAEKLYGESEAYDKTATTSEMEALRLEVRRLKDQLGNVGALKSEVDNLKSRVAREETFLHKVNGMTSDLANLSSSLEKKKEAEQQVKESVIAEINNFKQVENERRAAHERQSQALKELVDALSNPQDDSATDLDSIRSALNKMEKTTDSMRKEQVNLERRMQELKYKVDGTGPIPEGGRLKNMAKRAVGLNGVVETDEEGNPRTLNDPYKEKIYASMLETAQNEDLSEVQGTGCLYTVAQERNGTPCLFIMASKLPRSTAELHKVFLWGILEMDSYVSGPWSVVYVHGKGATVHGKWLNGVRSMLDPKYERNLQNFYVVHPSMALKLLFASFKAGSKVTRGKNLIVKGIEQTSMKSILELFPHVRLDTISECVPFEIYAEEQKSVSSTKKVIVMVEELVEIYNSIAQILSTRDDLLQWAANEAQVQDSGPLFTDLSGPFTEHASHIGSSGPCMAVYAHQMLRLLGLKQQLIDQDVAFQNVANHHQKLSHAPAEQTKAAKHVHEMMVKAAHNPNVTRPVLVEALHTGTAEELMAKLNSWNPGLVEDGEGVAPAQGQYQEEAHHQQEQHQQHHEDPGKAQHGTAKKAGKKK